MNTVFKDQPLSFLNLLYIVICDMLSNNDIKANFYN